MFMFLQPSPMVILNLDFLARQTWERMKKKQILFVKDASDESAHDLHEIVEPMICLKTIRAMCEKRIPPIHDWGI